MDEGSLIRIRAALIRMNYGPGLKILTSAHPAVKAIGILTSVFEDTGVIYGNREDENADADISLYFY